MKPLRISIAEGGLLIAFSVLGVLLAIAWLGRPGIAESQLSQNLQRFQSMSVEQQQQIRKAYAAWSAVVAESPERQKNLEELHTAVTAEPELQTKLRTFSEWWATVSSADRNVLQGVIQDQDARAISSRIFDDQQRSGNLIVDFSMGPFRFSRHFAGNRMRPDGNMMFDSLPPLELTAAQYARLLDSAFPESELTDAQQSELQQLSSQNERLLFRTLTALEKIRDGSGLSAFERVLPLIESLQNQMNDIDSGWASEFSRRVARGRPAEASDRNPRLLIYRISLIIDTVSVLDQAVIDFGRETREAFVVQEEQLIDAFENAPADVRNSLLTLSPDAVREQLQRRAVLDEHAVETPQLRLYRRMLSYDEALMSFHRLFSARPGPPGMDRGNGRGPDRFDNGPGGPRRPPGD